MKTVRLAEAVRARTTEAWGRGENERATHVVLESFEGVSFDRGALVDMATENELRSCGRECPQRCVAVLEWNFREARQGAPARW